MVVAFDKPAARFLIRSDGLRSGSHAETDAVECIDDNVRIMPKLRCPNINMSEFSWSAAITRSIAAINLGV